MDNEYVTIVLERVSKAGVPDYNKRIYSQESNDTLFNSDFMKEIIKSKKRFITIGKPSLKIEPVDIRKTVGFINGVSDFNISVNLDKPFYKKYKDDFDNGNIKIGMNYIAKHIKCVGRATIVEPIKILSFSLIKDGQFIED